MAKKKGLELDGLKGVYAGLKNLDRKYKSRAMKTLLRKAANKLKEPLVSAAPSTPGGTFKNKRNISTVADKELRGAISVGYIKKAYKARWIERGTKMRKTSSGANRGRISKKPWIDRTHRKEIPAIVKNLNDNATKIMVDILSRQSKGIKKKLNK